MRRYQAIYPESGEKGTLRDTEEEAADDLAESGESGYVLAVPRYGEVTWLADLLEIYDDDADLVEALTAPHRQLDGMSLLEALRSDQEEAVARVVEMLASGAFA